MYGKSQYHSLPGVLHSCHVSPVAYSLRGVSLSGVSLSGVSRHTAARPLPWASQMATRAAKSFINLAAKVL